MNKEGEKKGYLQLQMRSSKLKAFCEDFSFCVIGLWSPKRAPEDGLVGYLWKCLGALSVRERWKWKMGFLGSHLGWNPRWWDQNLIRFWTLFGNRRWSLLLPGHPQPFICRMLFHRLLLQTLPLHGGFGGYLSHQTRARDPNESLLLNLTRGR